MDQPPNSTMRAPKCTCSAWSGVWRDAAVVTADTNREGRRPGKGVNRRSQDHQGSALLAAFRPPRYLLFRLPRPESRRRKNEHELAEPRRSEIWVPGHPGVAVDHRVDECAGFRALQARS